jgi:hypothetical protein
VIGEEEIATRVLQLGVDFTQDLLLHTVHFHGSIELAFPVIEEIVGSCRLVQGVVSDAEDGREVGAGQLAGVEGNMDAS